MTGCRFAMVVVLLLSIGCSKYDAKLSPALVQLNELKDRLDHWQRNRAKLQTLISELKRDKANALEQLDRLGVVTDEDIANNPRAKIHANELKDILRQLPVYEKRCKEYDLAILQHESKLRAIERRLSAEAAGLSDAELDELARAMSAADQSFAIEMGMIPPALGEQWQDALARHREEKQRQMKHDAPLQTEAATQRRPPRETTSPQEIKSLPEKSAALAKSSVTERDAEDIRALLGTWAIENGDHRSEWTFREDGTVNNAGTWKLEPNAVRITWPTINVHTKEHLWDTFDRPIRPSGLTGDSWTGARKLRAKKAPEPPAKSSQKK